MAGIISSKVCKICDGLPVGGEYDAGVAAPRTAGFVNQVSFYRSVRQLPVPSIEYAEIMVNIEFPENINVTMEFRQ